MAGNRLRHALTLMAMLAALGVAQAGQAQQGEREQANTALARLVAGHSADTWMGLGGTELSLTLTQGVPWRMFTLDDPMRLVLDFREVDWSGTDLSALETSRRIASVRAGGFRPGWSRLVARLEAPMEIDSAALSVSEASGEATLTLRLSRGDAAGFAATAGAPDDPGWGPVTLSRPPDIEPGLPVIVLDPGHGGLDPGAQRGGISEADLMLTFARELREALRRTGRYAVVLTRDGDVFVSLEGRVARARALEADVFVSLHADAIREGVAFGASVYTLSEQASDAASEALAERHDRADLLAGVDLSGADDAVASVLLDLARQDNGPRSRALASHLVDSIKDAVGTVHKRPLRQAGFSVLKAADVPSVLVELGYLSTNEDLAHLQDPAWRARMARGLVDGIEAWMIEDQALRALRRQ